MLALNKEAVMTKDIEAIKCEFSKELNEHHRKLGIEIDKLLMESKEWSHIGSEMYGIEHMFGAGGLDNYSYILEFALEHGFDHVVDIGCAYGHQSGLFQLANIQYDGIDQHANSMDCYKRGEKGINYHELHYGEEPLKSINITENTLAVAVLSLGWNIYLYEDEKTLDKQIQALSEDFKHMLMYVQNDFIPVFEKTFEVEVFPNGFCYMRNCRK